MTNWPNGSAKVKPKVSSKYGPRVGGAFSFHYGTDFTGYDLVKAVTGGTVTFAGYLNPQAGNVVVYDLPRSGGETVTVVHMHLQRWSVKRGQVVKAGQQIGTMGASGNATGRCDHVEIRYWENGKMRTVDPEKWIADRIKSEGIIASMVGVKKTLKAPTHARTRPTTKSTSKYLVKAGTSGRMDAWTRGQKVSGNDVWFRNKRSKLWYWSGGFTSKSTAGLRRV